jgi:hypothetical protein
MATSEQCLIMFNLLTGRVFTLDAPRTAWEAPGEYFKIKILAL